MVSTKRCINKVVPTIHSSCRILICKVTKTESDSTYSSASEYLSQEGEVSFSLEHADTRIDREFVKFLLKTKLHEVVTFRTDGLTVELKLIDVQHGPSIHEMKDEDKVARAKEMKDKGKELFKQNKYEAAFYRFRAGVQYLIFLNDKTLVEADTMYVMLCNNMAMCQMKFNNPQHAIELCCKVLKVDEKNVKALYRRAVSYSQVRRWDDAHADLILAMSVESKNSSVKKLLDVVQTQLKLQHEEYKNVVKNMFR